MTLTQLQAMVPQMLQIDLDFGLTSNGETPLTADYTAVINQALRFISFRLVEVGYATFALTAGQVQYNIRDTSINDVVSQEITIPFSVTINNVTLRDRFSRAVGFWSIHELENQYPGFRNAASGVPILACWLGNNGGSNLILYPAPNSTVVSNGESYITGQVQAPPLVSGSDVPQIPDNCHEAIAALAAIYASTPAATEQEAWQRLQAMGTYAEPVEQLRQINLQALRLYTGNSSLYPYLFAQEEQQKDNG